MEISPRFTNTSNNSRNRFSNIYKRLQKQPTPINLIHIVNEIIQRDTKFFGYRFKFFECVYLIFSISFGSHFFFRQISNLFNEFFLFVGELCSCPSFSCSCAKSFVLRFDLILSISKCASKSFIYFVLDGVIIFTCFG